MFVFSIFPFADKSLSKTSCLRFLPKYTMMISESIKNLRVISREIVDLERWIFLSFLMMMSKSKKKNHQLIGLREKKFLKKRRFEGQTVYFIFCS